MTNQLPFHDQSLKLRDWSNLPLANCREALTIFNGNEECAKEWLRIKGFAVYKSKPEQMTIDELYSEAISYGLNVTKDMFDKRNIKRHLYDIIEIAKAFVLKKI